MGMRAAESFRCIATALDGSPAAQQPSSPAAAQQQPSSPASQRHSTPLAAGDDVDTAIAYVRSLISKADQALIEHVRKPDWCPQTGKASAVTPADGKHFKMVAQAVQQVWKVGGLQCCPQDAHSSPHMLQRRCLGCIAVHLVHESAASCGSWRHGSYLLRSGSLTVYWCF
jgi:hypothetical protein